MKMKEVYILGIGGSTPVFMELALACGYTIAGLYHYNDDRTGETVYGIPVLGSFNDLYKSDLQGKMFMLSQGDISIRYEVTNKIKELGGLIPTIIHPSATVSPYATVSDDGVIIGGGCIIQAEAEIKPHAVLWDQALVCHQSVIGNYCFVGPKALIGAHIVVDDFAFIGQASLLVSGKVDRVGMHSIVGAGAIVTKEVPDDVLVVGSPARVRFRPQNL